MPKDTDILSTIQGLTEAMQGAPRTAQDTLSEAILLLSKQVSAQTVAEKPKNAEMPTPKKPRGRPPKKKEVEVPPAKSAPMKAQEDRKLDNTPSTKRDLTEVEVFQLASKWADNYLDRHSGHKDRELVGAQYLARAIAKYFACSVPRHGLQSAVAEHYDVQISTVGSSITRYIEANLPKAICSKRGGEKARPMSPREFINNCLTQFAKDAREKS